ncbi:MAG: peptidoglycan-binding protein [Roseburia sp.]|nr:peptidoglycan-binding protein [Roseburia sp.]
MRTIDESNARAKEMCAGGYRYLYGGKGQDYTTALVEQLHKLYPSCVPLEEALKDADKGYKAIDCSGLVCDVLGISNMGSAQLRSTAVKRLSVSKANAQPGMVLWRSGHVAYVGEDLKIYEAAGTKTDMRVSTFDSRAGAFTELLVVKGSALAAGETSAKKANPYTEPTRVIQYKKIGMMKGDDVCWVQFELQEAGYDIEIDGKFGPASDKALRAFQASCKITVDGKCGPATRKYLKAN